MPKQTIELNNLDQAVKDRQSVSEPVFTKTDTTWRFHFVDQNGNDIDISGWLINFSATLDGDLSHSWDTECTNVNDGTDGKCEADVSSTNITEAGFYVGELRWTKSGNSSDPEDGRQHLQFKVNQHKVE